MRTVLALTLLVGSLASSRSLAAEKGVSAPGATLQKLSGGFAFTEGPTCDAAGNLFFTDQPNDRILKWSADGQLSTFLQPAGRANGMHFDAAGRLIACADEKNELWSIAPDGKPTTLLEGLRRASRSTGPTTSGSRPSGGLYFTDPFYARPWWTHKTPPQDGQHVYYLAPGAKALVRVTDDLTQPNGIVGSPDGQDALRRRHRREEDVALRDPEGRPALGQDARLRGGLGRHDARRGGQRLPHRRRREGLRPEGPVDRAREGARSRGPRTSASAGRTGGPCSSPRARGSTRSRTRTKGADPAK